MNLITSSRLIYLLRELINAQDNVSHTNEKGPEFAENTRILIQEREKIYQKILDYVDSLLPLDNNVKTSGGASWGNEKMRELIGYKRRVLENLVNEKGLDRVQLTLDTIRKYSGSKMEK